MKQDPKIKTCLNCQTKIKERYCPKCGNPKALDRIDKKYIFAEIGSVLNFHKGILFTIKELIFRPGITIKRFILGDRNRLMKPVTFIILSSLIYTLLRQTLDFSDDYIFVDTSDPSSSSTIISLWIQNNYGYGNLIISFFIAVSTRVFFKKYGYNFYEILILLCYVMGMGMLILGLFGLIEGLTSLKILQYAGVAFVAYFTWALGRFFDGTKTINYFKAFLSFLLGLVGYTFGILGIGSLIDFIK